MKPLSLWRRFRAVPYRWPLWVRNTITLIAIFIFAMWLWSSV